MKKKFLIFTFFLIITSFYTIFDKASAVASSCSATVTSHSVYPNSTDNYTIDINNTSSSNLRWIKITRPSAALWTITGSTASGWSAAFTSNDVTYTNGITYVNNIMRAVVTAKTAGFTSPSAAWSVQVSDDASGSK